MPAGNTNNIYVDPVEGIVADIGIDIHIIGISYRVRLEEPAEVGEVVTSTVIIQPGFRVKPSAGEPLRDYLF
jgi:hypothetical protein